MTSQQPPEGLSAENDRFWLVLHEPGCVPERKGPWTIGQSAEILREFMRANPTALIDYVTIDEDGPEVSHGPEWLQMLDGRSMGFGRRHNQQVREAFATRSTSPEVLSAESRKVYVTVSGLTGTGKSAVYAEVVIALQALGLTVEHSDPAAWRQEMGLLSVGGNDPHDFAPTIVMSESNIPRSPK